MLEKEIENLILEYLSYMPGYFWKNQSVGVYDSVRKQFRKSHNKFHVNGISDILGCLPGGLLVGIEVKTKKGRATENQKAFLEKIDRLGGITFIARSVEDVKEQLEELERRKGQGFMAMNEEKIKPCPFCGSSNIGIESSSGAWMMFCKNEKCGNMGFAETKILYYEDALKKWNTRKDVP